MRPRWRQGWSRADARPTITASANAPQTWSMGYSPDHHQPDKPALSGACALRHNGRDPTRPLTILSQHNTSTSAKPASHYFHAARSFLNAKTTDLMARPAPPPPEHGSLGTILAGVSSWADPIRRRCERGNDPHQREEYA